jgi:hypothetical protein
LGDSRSNPETAGLFSGGSTTALIRLNMSREGNQKEIGQLYTLQTCLPVAGHLILKKKKTKEITASGKEK